MSITSQDLAERNKPLRDDIRTLGFMLGDTIRALEGEPVFERIEDFRRLCKALHQINGSASLDGESRWSEADREVLKAELSDLIASLDRQTAGKIIKAFLCYFDVINIAEQNH